MAHELAHGCMVSLGLPVAARPTSAAPTADRARFVELRGLHEGLADVFGAAAEIVYARKSGKPAAAPYAIGEGMRAPIVPKQGPSRPAPIRDLMNPSNPDALLPIANHVDARFPGYIPVPGESKERTFANTLDNEAYFRSGLVSHTWALLAAGGGNRGSSIVIDKPIGVEWATATFGLGALSFRPGQSSLRAFADATVAANLLPEPRRQVACAWAAVGVYSSADLSTYRVTCTHATTSAAPTPSFACKGKRDGYYCDPEQPFAAVRCVAGSIGGGLQCASGLVCQPSGASPDSQAIVENGALRCAAPKETP